MLNGCIVDTRSEVVECPFYCHCVASSVCFSLAFSKMVVKFVTESHTE